MLMLPIILHSLLSADVQHGQIWHLLTSLHSGKKDYHRHLWSTMYSLQTSLSDRQDSIYLANHDCCSTVRSGPLSCKSVQIGPGHILSLMRMQSATERDTFSWNMPIDKAQRQPETPPQCWRRGNLLVGEHGDYSIHKTNKKSSF